MNRREYLMAAASALALGSVPGGAQAALKKRDGDAADQTDGEYSPEIQYDIQIPMRDGTHLGATLFLPREQKTPKPTIMSLTPYTADLYHPEGVAFARHGYPYLAVDVGGRGDSDGEFEPFFADPQDAHDAVEWIAKQPYCNGKVAMCGLSYVGYTQWAAVRGAPEHLATIIPSAPCWVGFDFPIRYNIFFMFAAPWLIRTGGKTGRYTAYSDGEFWQEEYLRFFEAGLPYRKLDEFFGFKSKAFQEWLDHPHQDEYWDRANPTPEQLANLTMPVLSLCGAYDGDQLGTVEFYREHVKLAGAKAKHYLVIGPWGHIEVRFPKTEFFGIKVGEASVIDMNKLHRDWYAWTMEEGPRPDFLKKNISYYVMVADKWRYADTLEGVTARYENLHLRSSGNASSVYSSGQLTTAKPAKQAEPDHYIYDPRDMSALRLQTKVTGSHLTDQTMVLSSTGDKLIYHGDPFEKDTEVSGFFKFTGWISLDQPDTDFIVSIYDIAPDGSSMFLTEQQMRARYREGLRIEKLITTQEPLRYDFDRFFFVSRIVKKGHRLRLVIKANHDLGWQKNYNSGKPVVDETLADARTVTVKLYHDAARPSMLSVPIGQPDTDA